MKQEYDIPVDRHGIRDEVKIMCNLSEGVEEMGYAKGEAAGKAAGRAEGEKIGEARGKVIGRSEGRLEGRSEERVDIILKMHKKGYTLEQIMDVTDMSESEITSRTGNMYILVEVQIWQKCCIWTFMLYYRYQEI